MKMEDQKVIVNLPEGFNQESFNLVVRNGEAPSQLDEMRPRKVSITGCINSVSTYLGKKCQSDNFKDLGENSVVYVDREEGTIELEAYMYDEYKHHIVRGGIALAEEFLTLGVNDRASVWRPFKLADYFRLHRYLFVDRSENMRLVTELKSFEGKVNIAVKKMEDVKTGSRSSAINMAVDSTLPKEPFSLRLPIIKGLPIEDIQVELMAIVNGEEIGLSIESAGAIELLESIKDDLITQEIDYICSFYNDLVIIEK